MLSACCVDVPLRIELDLGRQSNQSELIMARDRLSALIGLDHQALLPRDRSSGADWRPAGPP